jgi:transcriptional regulator with GAF, ATPase, and Fis domain
LFEVGNNGTIFLDEVSELSLSAQVKLLRVIQNGEIEKLGRTQVTKVDVRIIAATNKELKSEIKEKHFREDLYYRLNVVPINILPLRERREDIPVLVNHFLTLYGNEMRKVKPELSPDAEEVLCRSDWPGNVRELQNIVRRLLLNDLKIIRAENVLSAMGVAQAVGDSTYPQNENLFEPDLTLSLREAEEAFRRKYVKMVREKCASDAEASRKLGLLPSNYSRLIRSLGIK